MATARPFSVVGCPSQTTWSDTNPKFYKSRLLVECNFCYSSKYIIAMIISSKTIEFEKSKDLATFIFGFRINSHGGYLTRLFRALIEK